MYENSTEKLKKFSSKGMKEIIFAGRENLRMR